MPSTIISRFALLSVLAAVGRAAPPSAPIADAIQTLLSVSNLDVSQASQVSSNFHVDQNKYYATLTTDSAYMSAFSVANTALPGSVKAVAAGYPALFLASLAQEDSSDLPSWYTAMPTPIQDYWSSVGREEIDMFTSEVNEARPLPSSVSASLSSLSSKLASASSSAASVSASAVAHGGAPASPATSGHMMVVAAGVAIAAGLVGMAML